jgi:hypothetical protein
VVVGGIGTLVVVALVALIWPEVRRFGSLQDAKPLSEDGSVDDTDPRHGFEVLPPAPIPQAIATTSTTTAARDVT